MKFMILFCFLINGASARDKYSSYEELRSFEKEGLDYSIKLIDHSSPTSIFVIHGGLIETGTSELARSIQDDSNYYFFEGTKDEDNFSLHITSSKFDEPEALGLAQRSKKCLSLHGYIGKGEESVCIGGRNKELAEKIHNKLKAMNLSFSIEYPCKAYPGLHPENIINKCQEAGVQLELSSPFRKRLLSDKLFLRKIGRTLKDALGE